MKKFLIIGSIAVAAALGILIFASIYQPKAKNTAEILTPTPFQATAEPTPSPTPEIKILEEKSHEQFILLGFSDLLNVMTTTQYNYVMESTQEFLNSVYQSHVRNYPFEQFTLQYEDLLENRFNFADEGDIEEVFNSLIDAFEQGEQPYIFILESDTIQSQKDYFAYTVEFYINSGLSVTFDFEVSRNSAEIKIS